MWSCTSSLARCSCLGVGWNFLFTGSTTLSLRAYRPEEKDRAQAAINFCVFEHHGIHFVCLGRTGHHAGLGAAEPGLAAARGAHGRRRWRGLRFRQRATQNA